MTTGPTLQPLAHKKRKIVFLSAIFIFVISMPILIFYATGYRFDFLNSETGNIIRVGGMYISTQVDGTEMYVNDEPVEDMRVFQKAAYIQNLEEGIHRVHVQGAGIQTWVKELPVFAHFVTEAESINMPTIPQIRVITQWSDPLTNADIFVGSTTTLFSFATITNNVVSTSSVATSTYLANTEYAYIKSLFASSTEIMTTDGVDAEASFTFGTEKKKLTPTTTATTTATSTKQWRDTTLYKDGEEVMIAWNGNSENVPYYYCVRYTGATSTIQNYGEHIYDDLAERFPDIVSAISEPSENSGVHLCRDEIRIDRLQQDVAWFDFYPDSTDYVLMLLDDGLYVVEADDRSWQNTQMLYPGEGLNVLLDGGRIYVQDGDAYLEVFTEIAAR